MRHLSIAVLGLTTAALAAACSSEEGTKSISGGGDNGTGGTMLGTGGDGSVIIGNPNENLDATPGCGDGILTEDEACDDGNRESGDGCLGNCRGLEPGFSCPTPGQACIQAARCGDGLTALPELCDDGNLDAGDGCSRSCKPEVGYKCDTTVQPAVCTPTVCGDGMIEGAETCDDGNAAPGDGCSADCQQEPSCTNDGCSSICGDGLVIDEGCDDGNTIDGDGCSSACEPEPGFTCSGNDSCVEVNGTCTLAIDAIYRDFDWPNGPDTGLVQGMVAPQLVDGKPVEGPSFSSGGGQPLATWYADNHPAAKTLVGKITLFDNGSGGFVNRLTEDGDRFLAPGAQPYSDQPCPAGSTECVPCQYVPNQSCTRTEIDGNPMFFPVDSLPSTTARAKVAPPIAGDTGWSWPWENEWPYWPEGWDSSKNHNFYFTSEVQYWFKYDPENPATLEFIGDDDVWVFVNGTLAVDLGGTHIPLSGSFTLDALAGTTYNMTPGGVYPIKIFHAERRTEGSSFKLTLSGFNTGRSECSAFCGDGIVGIGEECDDGINDGGYGECNAGCVLGEYCGDGIVQEGEDCDDGNNFDGDGCGSACRNIIIQ